MSLTGRRTRRVSGRGREGPSRGDLARWAVGTGLVAVAVLLVVLLVGGGAPEPAPAGLPDAGPVTGWGLPLARLVAQVAGLATVGLLLVAALLLPQGTGRLDGDAEHTARLAARAALVWLLAVVVETALTSSDLLGVPPGDALAPDLLRSVLSQTAQGRGLAVQAVLVVLAAVLARASTTFGHAAVATYVAVMALAPPAFTGHSGSLAKHEMAVGSLLVHIVAASLWVGGLGALAWLATTTSEGLRQAVPRFSALALWCFVAVAVSGVVNAVIRLGGLEPLFSSSYGRLVLAKVVALGALGGLGWWHRHRTVAAVADSGDSVRSRREAARVFLAVAAVELVVMAATVALAVGLSRTPTPGGDGHGHAMPGPQVTAAAGSDLLERVPSGSEPLAVPVALVLEARG